MTASAAIEIALFSGLLPAIAAAILYVALGRMLPSQAANRVRGGLAFAVATLFAFVVLPSTKLTETMQFWEWIPFLGALAALVGSLMLLDERAERAWWLVALITCCLAAWQIVPTWDELAEKRTTQVVSLAIGMFLLAAALKPLAMRINPRLFPIWLMAAAGACAIVLLTEVSETIGRAGALPAAALVGCIAASWFSRTELDWRSLALPFAVIVFGFAFIGFIYPTPPLTPLLAAPFAPLALWLCTHRRIEQLSGPATLLLQAICVLTPLIAIIVVLLIRGSAAADAGDPW